MKKTKNIFRGIKNWFKAQIKCLTFKKIIKEQQKEIEKLEEQIVKLNIEVDNLKFELDRDDKLQRIRYLEKRVEEQHIQKRSLREEIAGLKSKNEK